MALGIGTHSSSLIILLAGCGWVESLTVIRLQHFAGVTDSTVCEADQLWQDKNDTVVTDKCSDHALQTANKQTNKQQANKPTNN